jgi:DNA modification methylase
MIGELMNQLILGDNLEVMPTMPKESVDLIYLDPPFFSNRNYEVIWGDKGEIRSFKDYWSGGIQHYISWLNGRVSEMHRLLKPTGSIFLHCDWHANAYIKVYILDKIFGDNNFKNEISWIRSNPKSLGTKRLPNCKDTIFFYSKSNINTFNKIFGAHDDSYILKAYRYLDDEGRRYRLLPLLNPNDDRPNLTYEFLGIKRVWRWTKDRMEKAYKEGLVVQLKSGAVPQYKLYLEESKGRTITDSWSDIENISKTEEIGYPTQKPEKLLERIILASSNEGDVVMDPFLGGGTTIVAADKLKRKWIGIDQSVQAIKVSEMRLFNSLNLFSEPFVVQLHKYDYDKLFTMNSFEFEKWIVEQYGGISNTKQHGEHGIDGKMRDGTPIQVKQSESVGSVPLRQFVTDSKAFDKRNYEKNISENKPIGYFIAFSFGKGAVQEVARLKNEDGVIIKLVRVDEIVPIAKKPKLSLEFKEIARNAKGYCEIEFTAKANSESGIEIYAWDWDFDENSKTFKPEILRDKTGVQTHNFKPGTHTIAVKAIDNDGLEAIEIIKLRVNGEIIIE